MYRTLLCVSTVFVLIARCEYGVCSHCKILPYGWGLLIIYRNRLDIAINTQAIICFIVSNAADCKSTEARESVNVSKY